MRSFVRCGAVLALASVACIAAAACGDGDQGSSEKKCEGQTCTGGADGAAGASSDSGVTSDGGGSLPDAPSCTPTSPTDEPDDDFEDENCDGIDGDVKAGVFVAPSGDDSNAGTMASPVSSIAKAIELATGSDKDVYVCNATYAETLGVADAVRIFGGYDCTDGWKRTKERAAVAPGSGIPLIVQNVTEATFDRLDFRAPDGVEPGESSVAAIVRGSAGVRFNRVTFDAGSGADGASGEAGKSVTTPSVAGTNGASVSVKNCSKFLTPTGECAASAMGGKSNFVQYCGDSTPAGLRGGAGGNGGNIMKGIAAQNGLSGVFLGAAGGKVPFGGNPGLPGKAGAAGKPGSAIGSIVDGMYVPSNGGESGLAGEPGQAGGGGSGGQSAWACPDLMTCYEVGSGGGQGGYPGCGGEAGKGGGAGGASIALLVVDSTVDITWSTARTSSGGAGAQPGAGAAGQPGGAGGKGGAHPFIGSHAGKPGGSGGNGGAGGPGGPGGGGPSIGILVVGSAPTTDAVTFDIGSGGPGASGLGGADGATGQTGDVVTLETP